MTRTKAFRRHQHKKHKRKEKNLVKKKKWNYKQHKTSPEILDKIYEKEIQESLNDLELGEIY